MRGAALALLTVLCGAARADSLTTETFTPERPFDYHWRVLALPERIVELLTTPLAILVELTERSRLDRRIVELLRTDNGRVVATPRLKVSFGDGLGLGARLGINDLSERRSSMSFAGLARVDGDWEVKAEYLHRIPSAEGRVFRARASIEIDDNAPYFGIPGGETLDARRVLSSSDATTTIAFDLTSLGSTSLSAVVEGGVLAQKLKAGSDPRYAPVMIGDVVGVPPGFDTTATYAMGRLAGRYDTRDVQARPTLGMVALVSVDTRFELGGEDRGAVQTRMQAEVYLPILPEGRTLVLRAGYANAFGLRGNDSTPLDLYPALGRETFLRGFERQRFRDRNAVWTGTEYRFPIWEYLTTRIGLDAVLFVDVGTTWGIGELDIDRVRTSYGGGLRAGSEDLLIFDVTLGRSNEGFELFLSAEKPL